MGGSVAVTLRESDGTEHRMCRWTNPLPWFVNNMRFVNKDPAHIKQWMTRWNEMRADWEKNKGKKKFEFPMTESYAPSPYLAPMGYGLVVLDMKNNMILTCQGYCSFGQIHAAGIAMDLHPNTIHDPGEDDSERDSVRAKEFFDAKRAIVQKFTKKVGRRKGHFVDTDIHYEWLIDMIKRDTADYAALNVKLDLSPFRLVEYEKCSDMRKDIEKLGFQITDEEDKMWKEWHEEMEMEE